jgi:hypothetical protein
LAVLVEEVLGESCDFESLVTTTNIVTVFNLGMLARSKQFLPEDVLIRAMLIATSICVGAEDDRAAS